jgi:hypothetical protein
MLLLLRACGSGGDPACGGGAWRAGGGGTRGGGARVEGLDVTSPHRLQIGARKNRLTSFDAGGFGIRDLTGGKDEKRRWMGNGSVEDVILIGGTQNHILRGF